MYSTSIAISDAEYYSASAVDNETVFYILDRHMIAPRLNRARSPVVDLRVMLFPPKESAKPSNPSEPPRWYDSLNLGFCSRYPITRCSATQCNGPA